tara:strand:+ start:3037 stop:3393 length:357 start_codon:yes stop_codon:yes gene_type:complete
MFYELEEREKKFELHYQTVFGHVIKNTLWGEEFLQATIKHLEQYNNKIIKVVDQSGTVEEVNRVCRALTTCPHCGSTNIEKEDEHYSEDLTCLHSELFCTACDFEYTAVYEVVGVQNR